MQVKFSLLNVATGEREIPGYVDANEIISWNLWTVPDDAPAQGIHRTLRGKKIVVLNMKTGHQHWTDQGFHFVSAKILEARGETTAAEIERADLAGERERELLNKKSPLAV